MNAEDIFAKQLLMGIKDSTETIDFLLAQCREIFEEERTKWRGNQTAEDLKDQDLWCEYHGEIEKKMMKYLWNWLYELVRTISIRNEHLPHSIGYAFESVLDNLVEDHSNKFIEELTNKLLSILIDEEKENGIINLQEQTIP